MKTNVLRAAVLFAILSPCISFSADNCRTNCGDTSHKETKETKKTKKKDGDDVVTRYRNVSSDDLRDNADVSDKDWEQHRDTVITD